nr:hypothetical protein BaRGS_014375 [Batillaria attramentaria]
MELPEVRQSEFDAGTVDEYPLVWKLFQQQGYTTLYAEDEPTVGTFNLRFNGFHKQPTDHYMRHFWQALWESDLRKDSQRDQRVANFSKAADPDVVHYQVQIETEPCGGKVYNACAIL